MVLERTMTQPTPPYYGSSSRYVVESPPCYPRMHSNHRLAASVPCNLNQLAVSSAQVVLFGPPPPSVSSMASISDQYGASQGTLSGNGYDDQTSASPHSTHSSTFITRVVPSTNRQSSVTSNRSSSICDDESDTIDGDRASRSQTPIRFSSHSPLHSSRSYPLQTSPFQSTLRHSPLYAYRHSALQQYRRNNTWTPTSSQILSQRPLTSLTNNVTSSNRSMSTTSLNTLSSGNTSYSTAAAASSASPSGGAVFHISSDRRLSLPHVCVSVQRLDLQRQNPDDADTVRGQIVISLVSRDRGGAVTNQQVADSAQPPPAIPYDPNELPEG